VPTDDITPADLVAAVQAVHATSAAMTMEGDICTRVTRHMAAINACEDALRRTFSSPELARLAEILVDMFRDPLAEWDDDYTLDGFCSDLPTNG